MKVKLLPLGFVTLVTFGVLFILTFGFLFGATNSIKDNLGYKIWMVFLYIVCWSGVTSFVLGLVEKISQEKYQKYLWWLYFIVIIFLIINGIHSGIFLNGHLNDSIKWSFK